MTARLIGGEMLVWSDLDGRHGPAPVRAAALRPLLVTAAGRTLVAGPHAPELIDGLPAEQMTLLVRGVPDADTLTKRYADRPGVTVLCGSLEKLAAAPAYDTVIALDGLGRLRSAEDDAAEESWAEDLALLVAVLRPGGRLLLGLENLFGLHRVLAPAAEPGDADWGTADAYDPARPAAPARLRAALREAGLTVERDYAAFPSPAEPTVLLGGELLADDEVRGFVAATVRAARVPDGGVLADPRRLLVGALRAGIAAELAPAWFVVARRGAGEAPDTPAGVVAAGPVADEVRRGADGLWTSGGVAVPAGGTLDELLLAASLRRDLPGLRELMVAWQSGDTAGVAADQVVAGPGGALTALAPAGDPLVALRRLAATMIGDGHAYLWPAPADEPELTVLLAAMGGREVEAGEVPALPAGPQVPALRELVMDRERLTRELAEARARHEWLEKMLTSREDELKRVRRINAVLLATMPGKAATASVGGLRAGKRAARAVIRRLRG